MKLTPEYITGFAEYCEAIGLAEKQASELLELAATQLDLKDPSFAAGFNEAMEKFAFQAPDLTGAFSAPSPTIAKGTTGFGYGALAGGALGLMSLLKPKLVRIPGGIGGTMQRAGEFINHAAGPRGVRTVLDKRLANNMVKSLAPGAAAPTIPLKTVGNSRIKHMFDVAMGRGNKRVLGGALAGGIGGAAYNINTNQLSGYGANMPDMDHWLPDAGDPTGGNPHMKPQQGMYPMQGGAGYPGSMPTYGMEPMLPGPGGYPLPPSGMNPLGQFNTAPGPYGAGPMGMGGYGQRGADPLDQHVAHLQSQMDNTGTMEGTLHNNRLKQKIQELTKMRSQQNSDASIFGGGVREEMAHAGQSVADKLQQVERAIRTREQHAGNAAGWLERTSQPTTLSNFLPQMLSKALGSEAGGQQINAELQELYRARNVLNQQLAMTGQNR